MSDFESVWSYDSLWEKTKIYIQKAFGEDRESNQFPFWSALALEFLGRATLAKVHPVLLADPRDGSNILYVFGYQKDKSTPKSIPAKTVFDRCKVIVSNFTDKEFKHCMALIERRNEELHSGSIAFENFPLSSWLSTFFKVLEVLLEFHEKELKDLLGANEADAAKEMIKSSDANTTKIVNKRIAARKSLFLELSPQKQKEKIEFGTNKARTSFLDYTKIVKCVCCGADALVTGKLVSASEAKLSDGDQITQDINILPTNFQCFSCELSFNNHQELDIAKYGGQFKITEDHDPTEYYGIDVNYEPDWDYGND